MIVVNGTGEELLLEALDAGAEDAEEDDGEMTLYTDPKDLARVRDALKEKGIEIKEAELTYVPKNTTEITDKDTAGKIERLMDALESLDNVSNTHVNFDIV